MNAQSEYSAEMTNFREKVLPRCKDPSKRLEQCRDSRQRAFVGLAISGGGSRAANYSAAVMQELAAMGILNHVDVISSVSGGSVAAAYYIIHRKDLVDPLSNSEGWKKAKADLSLPFRSMWVGKLLRPDNLAATLFGHTGRTEFMADVFDETLFKSMKMGQLPKDGPALILNATPINQLNSRAVGPCTNRGELSPWMRWESVAFRDWFFNGCLSSRLDTYPLSLAVAASAAFPGVFSAVPLARWDVQTRYDGSYLDTVAAEFVHVIDGGPSDNLGIDGLLGEWAAASATDGDVAVDRCLIISVDAFVRGDTDERALKADARGIFDRIVDTNFIDATDAMLARRRFDTLQRLGLAPPQFKDSERFININNIPIDGHNYQFFEQEHVAVDVTPRRAMGESTDVRQRLYADGRRETIAEPRCTVWHIGLDNMRSMLTVGWKYSTSSRQANGGAPIAFADYKGELQRIVQLPEGKHKIGLAEISTRIRTDFNLVGPKNCSSEQLRDILWEAGRLSVAADNESRQKICRWFKDTGLSVADGCDSPRPAIVGSPVAAIFVSPSSMYGDYHVACSQ